MLWGRKDKDEKPGSPPGAPRPAAGGSPRPAGGVPPSAIRPARPPLSPTESGRDGGDAVESLPQALLANLIRAGGDTFGYMKRSFQASVSAVKSLEAEVDQRIDALVKRGEMAEDEANRLREELSRERLSALVDPRLVDTRVEAALHRLNIPSRLDVVNLQGQLEQLNRALDTLLASETHEAETSEE